MPAVGIRIPDIQMVEPLKILDNSSHSNNLSNIGHFLSAIPNNRLIGDRTELHDLNTRLVVNSDPNCIKIPDTHNPD